MSNNEKRDWSNKPEEWLVEVLRGEQPEDTDAAMRILQQKYQSKLEDYAAKKLPSDWVGDVIQEIWVAFFQRIRVEKIKKGVSNLLWTLARYKRADAVRRLTAERNIEIDLPTPWGDDEEEIQIESLEEPIEEILDKQLKREFIQQVPFMGSLLSDCERVYWVLRWQLRYPLPVVVRLTGKKRQTVYSALSYAKKRVIDYAQGEEFSLLVDSQESLEAIYRTPLQRGATVVERFSNALVPQLTPDELKPLNLTVEEFQTNYGASLMLPWEPPKIEETWNPSLVLTRRTEWDDMQRIFERLDADRSDTDYLSPEECLLSIDVVDKNIVLTPEQVLEFLPEPEEWGGTPLSENTFFSVHDPRMTIPVTLGFFDRSLYTPELLERWPFLTEDAGL